MIGWRGVTAVAIGTVEAWDLRVSLLQWGGIEMAGYGGGL